MIFNIREKPTQFLWLIHECIEKFMFCNPLTKPIGKINLMPSVTSFERRVFEFTYPTGKPPLQSLLVPDEPNAFCW